MAQPQTDKTILLGEAPKASSGFAFDPDAFTTVQIAGALGVNPSALSWHFWVMNVFDTPQASKRRGFDHFPMEEAIERLGSMWIPNRRIVCVGTRVADALIEALGIDDIPENDFVECYPRYRKAQWEVGYIIHPSACRDLPPDKNGVVLSRETQRFLRRAAHLRG